MNLDSVQKLLTRTRKIVPGLGLGLAKAGLGLGLEKNLTEATSLVF